MSDIVSGMSLIWNPEVNLVVLHGLGCKIKLDQGLDQVFSATEVKKKKGMVYWTPLELTLFTWKEDSSHTRMLLRKIGVTCKLQLCNLYKFSLEGIILHSG